MIIDEHIKDTPEAYHTSWPGESLEHLLLEADCCLRDGQYYVGAGDLMDYEDMLFFKVLGIDPYA